MQNQTNREKILKAIRNGLINKTDAPCSEDFLYKETFPNLNEDFDILFAEKFTKAGGNFMYCMNELEFAEKLVDLSQHYKWKELVCIEPGLKSFLSDCDIPFIDQTNEIIKPEVYLSSCECLIARHGIVVLSSLQLNSNKYWHESGIHIVMAYSRQIVNSYTEALEMVNSNNGNAKPDNLTFIYGPAKSQNYYPGKNMPGIGPHSFYVFLIESENPYAK